MTIIRRSMKSSLWVSTYDATTEAEDTAGMAECHLASGLIISP